MSRGWIAFYIGDYLKDTQALTTELRAKSEKQRFACEAVVAAASALVTQRVCAGLAEDMPELHRPLLRFARGSLEAAGVALATA